MEKKRAYRGGGMKKGGKQRKPRAQYPHVTCPHCNVEGRGNVMYRWHFDLCSQNPDRQTTEGEADENR